MSTNGTPTDVKKLLNSLSKLQDIFTSAHQKAYYQASIGKQFHAVGNKTNSIRQVLVNNSI